MFAVVLYACLWIILFSSLFAVVLGVFLGSFFYVSPGCESKAACQVSPKSSKIEILQPREYAHRVERQTVIKGFGLEVAVGVLKVGFVKKQVVY